VAQRSARIDALRGFAVFGILVVNVWSFAYGYALYRYPFHETPSLADQLAAMFVAGLAEQKFYPIFAFLFGAGFALQTGRRPGAVDIYRRRLHWLLACGLVHGTLVWFGDILTAYAVTGFWLAPKAGRPLRELVLSLRIVVVVNLMLLLGYGGMIVASYDDSLVSIAAQVAEARHEHAVYTMGSWSEIAGARLRDFGSNLIGFVIFVPRLALLFLLGVFAVRLGWLTRPERHRAAWRKVRNIGLLVGVPLGAWWALLALPGTAALPGAALATALQEVAGPCLGAAYVAAFMLARERTASWLAPVGKMALTSYLTQSLLLAFLLQGFGLGLGAGMGHAQMLALCCAIMVLQLLLCRWWLAGHAQGPFEAAWRRYTHF
jgi:uncharacterized protein